MARDYRSGRGAASLARDSPGLPARVLQDWRTLDKRNRGASGDALQDTLARVDTSSGQLNPDWVEGLMVLPVGWTNPDIPNTELEPWAGWPARPGAAQYPYEPPRTGHKIPNRPKRLRALGNAVCTLQPVPLFEAIMAIEEEESID